MKNLLLTHYLCLHLFRSTSAPAQLLLECKDLKQQLDDMPREIKSWKAYLGAQDQVKNLALVLPLVNILHSPSMQDRHWEELASVTKKVFDVGPTFCLADLLKLQVRPAIRQFFQKKKYECLNVIFSPPSFYLVA